MPPRIQYMIRVMKTPPTAQTFGCFDVALRGQWLEAKGNPLSRLDTVMDWEGFRPLLVPALPGQAGPRPREDVCPCSAA